MQAFTKVTAIAAPLIERNVNTDAVIPSIWLRNLGIDLGEKLFSHMRYHPDGSEKAEFVLNREPFRKAQILLSGSNFGCGSSREQAVWALMRFGFQSVIAPSFGEIFYENAFQNGFLPVELPEEAIGRIVDECTRTDNWELTVDLEQKIVEAPGVGRFPFEISEERRAALLAGMDEFTFIMTTVDDIADFERRDVEIQPWLYQRKWPA